jgi:hypothetical protein
LNWERTSSRRRARHRTWALATFATFVGAVGSCYEPDAFFCRADVECSLAGRTGICTDVGTCAYLDPTCDSGWRYPPGVPGLLGGTCAPGPPPPGDDTTGSTGDDTETTSSGSTSETDGTTGTRGDTETETETETTGSSGEASTGTTTGEMCPDPDAPDAPEETTLTMLPGCAAWLRVVLDKPQDVDWYEFSMPSACDSTLVLDAPGLFDGVLCLVPNCPPLGFSCSSGPPQSTPEGLIGCCRDTDALDNVALTAFPSCAIHERFFVRIAHRGTLMCEPFDFDITADD